jgi:hypothetical protein
MDDSQIVLFADFDSANMARYEKVPKPLPANPPANLATSTTTTTAANTSTTEAAPVNSTSQSVPLLPPPPPLPTLINQPKYDVEYNVWTKPDCFGTPAGPNGNRYGVINLQTTAKPFTDFK